MKKLEIHSAEGYGKAKWNSFVRQNYPPVGAFMQSWEWGEFQRTLGRKVERYAVADHYGVEPAALFTVVYHNLPFGNLYGYVPRGPVISLDLAEGEAAAEILNQISTWTQRHLGHLVFMRLEPPLPTIAIDGNRGNFRIPPYYIQPRHNLVIPLEGSAEKIAALFHPSTRSNIKRAERRGVKAEMTPQPGESELTEFFEMARDTIGRNGGKNAYPNVRYFQTLLKTVPALRDNSDDPGLSLAVFRGLQHDQPAATHFVLFFGDTATYLFGASHNATLSSKAVTYLHWTAMQEAKKRGFKYYDLGGIDEVLWPTLTRFKRQFRGQELKYAGNLDIALRPLLYSVYNTLRRFRR